MKIKGLLTLALCALSVSAAAQFTTVAPAYEIALTNFRAPATQSGGLAFRRCDTCELQNLRVTPSTTYSINGEALILKDFRKALRRAGNRDAVTVVVKHDLETDTAVSVTVSILTR
jgi:hypothetical protein